ncbi:MAG: energy transducer TonB, partial [Polyangiaceae bacterium]|nr:energy transducer TonB [Polyangiaceae bacterium]
ATPPPPSDEPPAEDPGPAGDSTGDGPPGDGNGPPGVGGIGDGPPGGGGGVAPPPPPPAPTTITLPVSASMQRPTLISGPQPQYTREALAARVEGTVIAKCVITTEGRLRGCRIIKGLPHMEAAVLEALSQQRYTPVLFSGRPINVEYVLSFKMTLR